MKQSDIDNLKGKSLKEAQLIAAQNGWELETHTAGSAITLQARASNVIIVWINSQSVIVHANAGDPLALSK